MMVSANSASCTPVEPTVAGPSARKNWRTSASSSRPAQRGKRAGAPGVAADQQRLQHAGDQHAPGGGMAGGREEGREQQRHDHRQIEQDRRRGGGGETLQAH